MDFCLNLKRDLEIHNISYLFKDLTQKKLEDFWPYSSVLPTFFPAFSISDIGLGAAPVQFRTNLFEVLILSGKKRKCK